MELIKHSKEIMGKFEYLPLKILLSFLIFTEVLFWVGPVDYKISNSLLLVFYLAVLNLSLYAGYKNGLKSSCSKGIIFGVKFVEVIVVIGLIGTLYYWIYLWLSRGLSISLNTIINSFIDSGKNYHSKTIGTAGSTTILTLLSPFNACAVPLGIYYWEKISRLSKINVLFIIFITLIMWFGIGTRKGIIDIAIVVFFTILAKNAPLGFRSIKLKKTIPFAIIIIGLFLFYFVVSNVSRSGLKMSEVGSDFINHDIREWYNRIPFWLLLGLSSINSYLCQGYYALSEGLKMGILPITFGGSNWFTINLLKGYNADPTMGTYMYQLQKLGIDMSINWHTAYLWFANDVTFLGVPIIIFIIGHFLGKTWKNCLLGRNDLAIVMMGYFTQMVFYLFANNQVLSFSFVSFTLLFIIYLITKK